MLVFAEQDDADLSHIHIECDSEHVSGKGNQLFESDAGEAGNLGYSSGDTGDPTHFHRSQAGYERFPSLAYSGEGPVHDALEAQGFCVHWGFASTAFCIDAR
jgi:hypothetical protein